MSPAARGMVPNVAGWLRWVAEPSPQRKAAGSAVLGGGHHAPPGGSMTYLVVYTWAAPLPGFGTWDKLLNVSGHQCFQLKNGANHLSLSLKL